MAKGQKREQNGHSTAPDTEDNPQEAWQGFYQKMAEDGMQFFQQSVEMAQKCSPFFPNNELMTMWAGNYQDFLQQVQAETTESKGFDPDSYKRLYEAWLNTWTHNLEGYMRTPEFAEKSGKNLETMSEMQKKMGDFMESYWQMMRLPSAQDMREIYHKLYLIERKLDEIDSRLNP